MVIQCDIDGVLNDLMDVVLRLFNEKSNKSYTVNDLTSYSLSDCLPKEDAIEIQNLFTDSNIWNLVRPVKDSQASIKKLIQEGHEVYLVTNNDPHTFGDKYDWIQYYFPFVDISHIVCMTNKWMFNCDVMIEDSLDNLITKTTYERILVNQPWNQFSRDYVYGIYRCNDWKEIIEAINKINNNLE